MYDYFDRRDAYLRTAATAVTGGILTLIAAKTNISPGWFSGLLFVGGALNLPRYLSEEYVCDTLAKSLNFLRKSVCVAAILSPVGCGLLNEAARGNAREALAAANYSAIHQVLDGKESATGCADYRPYAVVNKLTAQETISAHATILSREEPEGVEHPGRAEVMLGGRSRDETAESYSFRLVRSRDGTVTYYKNGFDISYFGKRGEAVVDTCHQ